MSYDVSDGAIQQVSTVVIIVPSISGTIQQHILSLIIRFIIKYPVKISREQEKLLQQFADIEKPTTTPSQIELGRLGN